MKILMFGRGVISTQYGWALEQAGHEVDFYVRPGRMAEYGPYVELDLLDGRKSLKGHAVREQWKINMREELSADHHYDLIVLSVNHEQFREVAAMVAPIAGKATILVFNNLWDEPHIFAAGLPQDQIVWGFPGGGGGFRDKNKLEGGFVKSIFLEAASAAASKERHQSVVQLFRQAGFSFSMQKDMRVWYWFHFIMNAGMGAQALKEGSYLKMFESPAKVKKAILLMREMLPLIPAKGGKVDLATSLLMHMPAGLIGYAAYKILRSNLVPAAIMDRMVTTNYISNESFAHFPKDVLAEARKLGVPLPRLEQLEPYFS